MIKHYWTLDGKKQNENVLLQKHGETKKNFNY